MTFEEFERQGYKIVEKSEAHAYCTVKFNESGYGEYGYDLDVVNEHMFELNTDSDYISYIIYDKDGFIVETFDEGELGSSDAYHNLVEFIQDM